MGEHPFYRFFRRVSFPLSRQLFHKMPRHPSFKHEYWDGKLHWTPRPHTCSVYLDLATWQPPPPSKRRALFARDEVTVRRLAETDWPELPSVFCSAFIHSPPLSQWSGPAARRASRCIVEWIRLGRDGPLVPEACVVAHVRDRGADEEDRLAGAALVTLLPANQMQSAPGPQDAKLAHLTWLFVCHWEHRRGVASRMLGSVVNELRALGHETLASTILTASEAPMLWHWRNGFRHLGGW